MGIIAYAGTNAASHSTSPIITVPLVFAFAFGITVSSVGLYHILGGTNGSRMALIAAVDNVVAAGQLPAMIMVQLAVWAIVEQPGAALKAVWWGLNVAWDLYVGPLIGLWYFGGYLRLGISSVLLERQQRRSLVPLEGKSGPN